MPSWHELLCIPKMIVLLSCLYTSILFSTQQRWAHAYRDVSFHRAVDTNNGTEALNKVLKYGYLPKRRSLTLSQIVTLLLEQFLPDCYQKYLFQNFKLTSFNRSYKAFVPSYLHDRPRDVILHCLDRKGSSRKFSDNDIDELENKTGKFQVHGKTRVHTVDLGQASGMPSCTCLDWIKHHIPCKHMFAIIEHKENWSWNDLPQQYLSQPHLCADVSALQAHFNVTASTSDLSSPDLPDEDTSSPCCDEIPSRKV